MPSNTQCYVKVQVQYKTGKQVVVYQEKTLQQAKLPMSAATGYFSPLLLQGLPCLVDQIRDHKAEKKKLISCISVHKCRVELGGGEKGGQVSGERTVQFSSRFQFMANSPTKTKKKPVPSKKSCHHLAISTNIWMVICSSASDKGKCSLCSLCS